MFLNFRFKSNDLTFPLKIKINKLAGEKKYAIMKGEKRNAYVL